MDYYRWSLQKNEKLKSNRGISFEQIVKHLEDGDLIEIIEHPNKEKYPKQRILIVNVSQYVYLVPFVEDEQGRFLKTIIPSRKATMKFLGGKI